MKRQKEGMESLVYAYGIVPPCDNQYVRAEVERMRDMWNALLDNHIEHKNILRQSMLDSYPEYAKAIQALDDAYSHLKEAVQLRNQARAKARSKKVDPALQENIRDAFKIKNAAQKEVWNLEKKWRLANKEKFKEIEDARRAQNVEIRKESGLYWGNYNQVVDRFELTRISCFKKPGAKIRRKESTQDYGDLTVQIQRTKSGLGADPQELMNGTFKPLQIDPVDPVSFTLPRAARTRACKTTLHIRVDAAGHVVSCPVWFHRPLPEDCRIKKAQITWKREGEKVVGRLCLTLSKEKAEVLHPGVSAVGIDVGWRKMKDGSLLVATTADTQGKFRRYFLDAKWMKGMDQVYRLSSHIDEGLAEVGQFIFDNKEKLSSKLVKPAKNWIPGKGSRFIDASALHDAVRDLNWEVPQEVKHWYDRYRHLLLWRDNLRLKLVRRRKEQYRLIALELAQKYSVIGLEEMDLSKMARTKKRGDHSDNELFQAARENRTRAGLYVFRSELENQIKKLGSQLVKVESPYTTMYCKKCLEITKQEDRSQRFWNCEHCGKEWDQDENAAENIRNVAAKNANPELLGEQDKKVVDGGPIVVAKNKGSRKKDLDERAGLA